MPATRDDPSPSLTVRTGHPDFLDLDWSTSITDWTTARVVDLPKGISRHEVRFVAYDQGIYAVKELPTGAARNDYAVLRALERVDAPAVIPVALIEDRHADPSHEQSAALITKYVDYSFSYRELLEGQGFGRRRRQMLGAFAGLLVDLHLSGCFWGDCSLSNVLYRYDAMAIEATMVDAETAAIRPALSDGQRHEDLLIMEANIQGGMCDIAASQGLSIDAADSSLGPEISAWYTWLWDQATAVLEIRSDERFRIADHVSHLNNLGFAVDELDLDTVAGSDVVRVRPLVTARNLRRVRLRDMTGIGASEAQATEILADLERFARHRGLTDPMSAPLAAVLWRVERFEPALARIRDLDLLGDPVQSFCDYLNHRTTTGDDGNDESAFQRWIEAGRPGHEPDAAVAPSDDGHV